MEGSLAVQPGILLEEDTRMKLFLSVPTERPIAQTPGSKVRAGRYKLDICVPPLPNSCVKILSSNVMVFYNTPAATTVEGPQLHRTVRKSFL